MNLIIGANVSFNKDKGLVGSVLETLSYGANTFMFYTGSNRSAVRKDIDEKIGNEKNSWYFWSNNNKIKLFSLFRCYCCYL